MHGELARQRREDFLVALRFERDDDRDLAETVGNLRMHIAADDAAFDAKTRRAAQGEVFADIGDRGRHGVGHGAAGGIGLLAQLLDIGLAARQGDARDIARQGLEILVAGDEIGLGIDFDDNAGALADQSRDQTLGGDAPGLLGGLGQALLAQPVDRRFDVAVILGQRGLAVHHAGAGALAQFLHQSGCNRGHG